jgi:vacuolar-type H+-ATPase subunit E/Vma4
VSIDPAGEALLADARADAERLQAEADAEAEAQVARARREADELIARARAQGEADGRAESAREEAREAMLTRMEVLAAHRAVYEELLRRARTEVLKLRGEPSYPDLLERLAAACRRDLGDEAQLEIDPPDAGGVRASAGSRRVDYTLVALAESCVRELGPRLLRLWR